MPLIKINTDSLAQEILTLISTGGTAAVSQAQLTSAINAMSTQIQNEIDATEATIVSNMARDFVSKSVGELLSNLVIKKTVPEIVLDTLRVNKTKISWYYNSGSDLGLLFNIDGANALRIKRDGTVTVFKGGTEVELETTAGSQTKANDAIQSAKSYTDAALAAYESDVASPKYFSKTVGGTISGSVSFTSLSAFYRGMSVLSDNSGDERKVSYYRQDPSGSGYALRFETGYEEATKTFIMRGYNTSVKTIANSLSFETALSNRIGLNDKRFVTTYDLSDSDGIFGEPDYFAGSNARTYFVNASTGVNAPNRGLSASSPLKTVQYAIDLIEPTYLSQVQIILKGNTNEDVRIVGKNAIKIFIDGDNSVNGSGSTAPTGSLPDKLNSINLIGSRCYVSVRGIEFLNSQTRTQYFGSTLFADLCGYISVGYCRFAGRLTDDTNKAIDMTGATSGYVYSCSFVNQYACISASALARVRTSQDYGTCSGNTIGLRAVAGGQITRYSTSNPDLGAATAASTAQGGQII